MPFLTFSNGQKMAFEKKTIIELATSLHKRVEAQKKKLIKHGVATSLH
jgi:hypothetical protein